MTLAEQLFPGCKLNEIHKSVAKQWWRYGVRKAHSYQREMMAQFARATVDRMTMDDTSPFFLTARLVFTHVLGRQHSVSAFEAIIQKDAKFVQETGVNTFQGFEEYVIKNDLRKPLYIHMSKTMIWDSFLFHQPDIQNNNNKVFAEELVGNKCLNVQFHEHALIVTKCNVKCKQHDRRVNIKKN